MSEAESKEIKIREYAMILKAISKIGF